MRSSLLVLALLGVPALALAQVDGNPATDDVPRVVPYDGVLNLDGVTFDGQVDIRFSLFAAPAGGLPVWSEAWTLAEQRPVQVTAGRFSVNLGSFEPIIATIEDAGTLYLGIEVRAVGAEPWVALAGRQRINPVPYALWSASAADLNVAGLATVGRLDVTGRATFGENVEVTGGATVGGDVNATGDVSGRNVTASGAVAAGETLAVTGESTLGGLVTMPGGFLVQSAAVFEGNLHVADGQAVRFWQDDDQAYQPMLRYSDDGWLQVGERANTGVKMARPVHLNRTLTVVGDVNFSDCRICLNFDNDDDDLPHHACVQLTHGASSPWKAIETDLNSNNKFKLSFRCDGGGNSRGSSIVD